MDMSLGETSSGQVGSEEGDTLLGTTPSTVTEASIDVLGMQEAMRRHGHPMRVKC